MTIARTVLCAVSCLSVLAAPARGQPVESPTAAKHLLLLHQAGGPGPFRGKFDVAFDQAIRSSGSPPIEVYEEAIDAQRFPGASQSALVKEYLKVKYAGRPIDVIVAQGMAPLLFARQNRSLFGDPPIVAAVSPLGQIEQTDNTTGVQGGFFINGTIDLGLALAPDTRNVVVVDGARDNSPELQAEIERQVNERDDGLGLIYLRDLPLSEVVSRIATAPPRSMVLFVKQSMLDATQDVDQFEALDKIIAVSPAPVFSQLDQFLGHGIVGGYMWRFEDDARRMGEMARRIADGVSVAEIPPVPASYDSRIDWRQLQRWRIPEARVPPGAMVLFRQPTFVEQNRRFVIGAVGLFLAQFTLILALLLQGARRRVAQAALGQAEARNSAMLRAIPDLMFVLLRDGTYIDCHAKDPRLLYASPSEFIGKKVRDIMPPRLAEVMMEAIEGACQREETVVVEYDLTLDEIRYFEARIVHAGNDRVVSIVRDVTDSKRAWALNRDLTGRLIASQEVERQRIARELHDDISQKVALLNIGIDEVARQVETVEARARLHQLSLRTGEIVGDLRDLSHELHASRLQSLGLVAAIEVLCRDTSKQLGVTVPFTHGVLPQDLDPNVALCLYRIAQEALSNIARHSQARHAQVMLINESPMLTLQIADSGVGFDLHSNPHSGLGLISMRDRVAFMRGQLAIHATPGGGTRIGVNIPIEAPAEASSPVVSRSA